MKITEEFLRQEQLKRDKKLLIMTILIIILCIRQSCDLDLNYPLFATEDEASGDAS